MKLPPQIAEHTPIISSGNSRFPLLRKLRLRLVYQMLLVVIRVPRMLGLLICCDRALVREAVEDAKSQGGPSENLD
jgi:hypothetical protein